MQTELFKSSGLLSHVPRKFIMKKSAKSNNCNSCPYGPADAGPLFPLGRTVATSGALALLDHAGVNASTLLVRHQNGDFGDIDEEDRVANSNAIRDRTRIFSAYVLGRDVCIWIITEADRSVTTLLLPEEY